jgi:rhodanese-related sulfurtransferase/DNA-directed RNA polymerase subunit RPC12/RpoP
MKTTIILIVVNFCAGTFGIAQSKKADPFVCVPCGNGCDQEEHNEGGKCPHCNMDLVRKSSIKHKGVSAEKVCSFIAGKSNIVLLDVRTQEEFNGTAEPNFGTLKNAINIPIDELQGRLSELNKHKGKTILVFCSHSHRSPRASYLLTQNGFKDVVNLEGGMSVMNEGACKKK